MAHSGKPTDASPRYRRGFLRTVGTVGVAGLLAGCLGDDDADDTTDDFQDDTDDQEDISTDVWSLSNLDPENPEIGANESLTVAVDLENVSDEQHGGLLEFQLEGSVVKSSPVTLAGGESETITFADVAVDFEEQGSYEHGFQIDGVTSTGTLEIVSVSAPQPPVDPADYHPGTHPSEAEDTFDIADGYQIELVAHEPLIDSPLDIQWDAAGRLWVLEMPDYLAYSAADEKGGNDLNDPHVTPYDPDHPEWGDVENLHGWGDETTDEDPNGSVTILEDVDNDGFFERATTFLDDLTLPRAFALVDGDEPGALVAQAGGFVGEPDLLYAKDTDGDLEADEIEGVVDDWVDNVNVEHTVNGLDFMLDNWLYTVYNNTDGGYQKFRFRNGELESRPTQNRIQWGITQDEWGRIATGRNNPWFLIDFPPANGEYLAERGHGSSGINQRIVSSPSVKPVRENFGTNRSYTNNFSMLDEHNRLTQPRSGTGPGFYRDDLFPDEMRNNIFSACAKSNVVARLELFPDSDELEVDVEHHWYDHHTYDYQEFLGCTDEIFRPITVKTGPDGALYVVDMYHGPFQHHVYMTPYLASYYMIYGLNALPSAGRIYRIYPEDAELKEIPDLSDQDPDELASYLDDENGWIRDTAKRVIVQNNETAAAESAREIAADSDLPQGRIHALWTLHGIGEIDWETVDTCLDHPNAYVREHAIRTGEQLLSADDAEAYVEAIAAIGIDDDTLRVVAQAANSLGEVQDSDLQAIAEPALQDILDEHGGNTYVAEAVESAPHVDVS